MDRRAFVTRTAALGCSLAASPLVTPVSFAAPPGDNRLVVIVLRGGMDGLAAIAPYGDPNYAAARGDLLLGGEGYDDLDGYFAMHRGLRPLRGLWDQEQLGFVHAVSTPYRDKRSHFDGQDLLESGGFDGAAGGHRAGWLNRLMGAMPAGGAQTAYAIGNDALAILDGVQPVKRWSPEVDLALSPQAIELAKIVTRSDPHIAKALAEAFQLAGSDGDGVAISQAESSMMAPAQDTEQAARGKTYTSRLAQFAAQRLRQDARIASFSVNGWDTHIQQDNLLNRSLTRLSDAILTLKSELGGPIWRQTAVVAMTEFGRTVHLNGTKGTDHGTGGAMVLAGGAIRGGRVYTDWPGLSEAALYQRRDLMPTRDLRAYAGWMIRGLFGVPVSEIEQNIFPQLSLGDNPNLLL